MIPFFILPAALGIGALIGLIAAVLLLFKSR
jgi:hypothetical protein